MTTAETACFEIERRAACDAQDFLFRHGGDSTKEQSSSPRGDGRWVNLYEIFPRDARGNQSRQAIRRLHARGLLMAFEIAYYGGCVFAIAAEEVARAEADAAAGKYGR